MKPKPIPAATPPSKEPQQLEWTRRLLDEERALTAGGGEAAVARQHERGRLTARERIAGLIDPGSEFFELGIWAGFGMYDSLGGAPAAGVVTGLGTVSGRRFMLIANDATVKAGAFFPQTAKKVLRAQRIATDNRLPLIYLVDSAGVFLPLQDEVFPDEDDFGRIFRNNAVISAMGIPQFTAVMGSCVAGGAYLPVLCDKLLMTEGSGLYLAGPALVKAAIGQQISDEDLGGAAVHMQISGTIDFREADDPACLKRLRSLASFLPGDPGPAVATTPRPPVATGGLQSTSPFAPRVESKAPKRAAQDLYSLVPADGRGEYDVHHVLDCILDADSFEEYKADFGKTLVCGYARLDGYAVGVVANQKQRCTPKKGPMQFGGVIYVDSADKAARFVMDCNQSRLPILFFQDVNGFMVGRDAEHEGIIRSGAKLVNAVSNSVVPKITTVIGGSYGAGNYALCGKAFDPRLIFAWPNARYAVMGGAQAADTLFSIERRSLERQGKTADVAEMEAVRKRVQAEYERQTDIRYAAARGWVDKVIDPATTRRGAFGGAGGEPAGARAAGVQDGGVAGMIQSPRAQYAMVRASRQLGRRVRRRGERELVADSIREFEAKCRFPEARTMAERLRAAMEHDRMPIATLEHFSRWCHAAGKCGRGRAPAREASWRMFDAVVGRLLDEHGKRVRNYREVLEEFLNAISHDPARAVGRHLVIDPRICHGKLTFKGTRVPVETVLNCISEGRTVDEIIAGWPQLTREAITEAVRLAAAALTQECGSSRSR